LRELDAAACGRCLAEAAAKPYFELPLFTHELKQTIARVNLVAAVMPALVTSAGRSAIDHGLSSPRLRRPDAGQRSASHAFCGICSRIFYGKERMEWVAELAPQTIAWSMAEN